MAKFIKLNIGGPVASSGGRVWKKLIAESGGTVGGYLTFSSPNSFTLKTNNSKKNWNGTLEYSTDASNWHTWSGTTTLSADSGKLYLRGTGNTVITGEDSYYTTRNWVLTGTKISCSGNIENLLDYEMVASGGHPTMADYCYYSMFTNCTALKTAPELPATTLAPKCYHYMFYGCSALTAAPELPATTLADCCYSFMFYGCSALAVLPKLPAATLPTGCYWDMFYSCTGIKLSTTQTGDYQTEYRIPTSETGTKASLSVSDMFTKTGGTFTGTPTINTTYYTSNTVV